jgi:hypothetical protein
MTVNIQLQQMKKAFVQAQTFQLDTLRMGRPSGASSFMDALMGRRAENQLARVEKLLNKVARLLDKLSGDLGGGSQGSWNRPMPWAQSSDWQSAWPGGFDAEPGEVIAGKGRIWGDPHFIGADGGKYDVQGEAGKTYNLLSDDGFQMNGRFDAWGSGGATVVGEVGINAKGDKINVKGDGTVTVNGREVEDGERVRLSNGGFVKRDGDDITVKSGEWKVEFQAKDSRNGDYLNMDVSTDNAVADGVKPHGLLGQTFDGDGIARNGDKGKGAQGGGAIEDLALSQTERGDKTAIQSYEVSSLTSTDFTSFNRYTNFSGSNFDDVFGDLLEGADSWGFGNGWGFGSSTQAMEMAEDFFGGFGNSWNFNSDDDALRAVSQAYGSLAISIVSSTGNMGWTGFQWDANQS